jgi:hypothetical protein
MLFKAVFLFSVLLGQQSFASTLPVSDLLVGKVWVFDSEKINPNSIEIENISWQVVPVEFQNIRSSCPDSDSNTCETRKATKYEKQLIVTISFLTEGMDSGETFIFRERKNVVLNTNDVFFNASLNELQFQKQLDSTKDYFGSYLTDANRQFANKMFQIDFIEDSYSEFVDDTANSTYDAWDSEYSNTPKKSSKIVYKEMTFKDHLIGIFTK